ncbi:MULTISPECIES: hypothetical protein [unclassified Streptomyces]|uniref:hypothetical protein n=1 Tax=unclassified Streptomyces TaxID=2593676 RepID=UPI001BE62D3D|nr:MULTISPECIES: hypothetical protein [unclassified Streptomyces]MBT2404577.1 hypothetical protein [Streptomyces sp. ISL-21]MBT2610459.1 hypothetical protein [Streptomyces sp. ISL-87]
MDPLTPAVVRAAGTITGAALGRYRPVGVIRVGSAEDRAQSYRRFLDAVVYAADAQILYYYRRRDAAAISAIRRPRLRSRRNHLREQAWRHYTQAQIEVHAALLGVRLSAPTPVLAAAEHLVASIPASTGPAPATPCPKPSTSPPTTSAPRRSTSSWRRPAATSTTTPAPGNCCANDGNASTASRPPTADYRTDPCRGRVQR